jgi:NCAIR mutase (PurE)-related protein
MKEEQLLGLLEAVRTGELSPQEALRRLQGLPFEDLGFAKVDHHRALRRGFPEVVLAEGKTPQQTAQILERLAAAGGVALATRASPDHWQVVRQAIPSAVYHEQARVLATGEPPEARGDWFIAVVTAGTSDIPVAEEAAVVCQYFGNQVRRLYDVGVAGLHRLFAHLPTLQEAAVVIVVAGMEGALASVVGGLVSAPVIAVPTSVGYGANFGGLAPLLTMLNSCAAGVAVVNIDNGFGAACFASAITRLLSTRAQPTRA